MACCITVTVCVAAGDSRAILIKKGGKVKEMSIDHRPDRYKAVASTYVHCLQGYVNACWLLAGRTRSCAFGSSAGPWCTGAGGAWRASWLYPGKATQEPKLLS
jgi:hypothetical protein